MTTDELAKMSDEELTGDQRAWLAMDDDALLHQYSGAVQWRARGYEEKDTGHNFIHTELLRRLSPPSPPVGRSRLLGWGGGEGAGNAAVHCGWVRAGGLCNGVVAGHLSEW